MPVEEKAPIPAWLVSFGDMMTLILTFFILLVSMAQQREYGMIAEGLGSFVSALRSHGLPGFLTDSERRDIHDSFRRRFNLPPEADDERRETHSDASDLELLRAQLAQALEPHDELFQPQIAGFALDSAELDAAARAYLDRLAQTLRPRAGQLLLIEGHAADAGARFSGDDRWLAAERAQAVREYLLEQHDFEPARVEARAWFTAAEDAGAPDARRADARLITPVRKRGDSDG
ncbi:MAG TPA: flagellar motor protein MotB [Planctomycetota bacterium]|nr:flagellar motor protein MotB [Planctomycetota bacterium]